MRTQIKLLVIMTHIVMILQIGEVIAEDLGRKGNVFEIREEGFVEMMKRKLYLNR